MERRALLRGAQLGRRPHFVSDLGQSLQVSVGTPQQHTVIVFDRLRSRREAASLSGDEASILLRLLGGWVLRLEVLV